MGEAINYIKENSKIDSFEEDTNKILNYFKADMEFKNFIKNRNIDSMNVILRCSILILGSLIIAFSSFAADRWPAEPPAEAPTDWGPVSANFEEINYVFKKIIIHNSR